jgi:hypothetical protein
VSEQVIISRLVQMLSPFGIQVRSGMADAVPARYDVAVFVCTLVVRDSASRLQGQKLGYSFSFSRRELMLMSDNPDELEYWVRMRARLVLSELLIAIQETTAAPAPPPPADDDPQPFVVGER